MFQLSRHLVFFSVSLVLALALSAPAQVNAQATMVGDGPSEVESLGTTFQDSTGLSWAVASLELGLLVSALAIAVSSEADQGTVGLLMVALGAIASGVASGLAQGLNAPVEPAMVFNQSLSGGALLGGMGTFSLTLAGIQGDAPSILGVIGLIAGAGGAATYSILRMDRLARDPELVEEAHVLAWTPLLSAALIAALFGAVGFDESASLIGAVAGLLALGLSITLVEVAIAEHPAPGSVTMPLLAYGSEF